MTKDLDLATKPVEPHNDDTVMNRWMKFKNDHPEKKSKKPLLISILTIIIIIIGSGGYFAHKYFAYSNEQLFNSYFECYNIVEDKTYEHMQAIKKYKDRDFEQAIVLFSELSRKDTVLGSDEFYLAISYAKCEKFNKAIDIFYKISLEEKNFYRIKSAWYLGLCYLKVHENEKAREQFRYIHAEGKDYKNEAGSILERMKD